MRQFLMRRLEPNVQPSYLRPGRMRGIEADMTQPTTTTQGRDAVIELASAFIRSAHGDFQPKDVADDVLDTIEAIEREATKREIKKQVERVGFIVDEIAVFRQERDFKNAGIFCSAVAQELGVGLADIRVKAFGLRFGMHAPKFRPGECDDAALQLFIDGMRDFRELLGTIGCELQEAEVGASE